MKRWLLLLLLLPLFATAQTPVNPQGPKQNQSYIDNVGALWFFVNNTWFPLGGTGFANPMTTAGDIITGGVAGIPTRLGIGGANTVLSVNLAGTGLEYRNIAASSGISGSYSAGLISLVLNENVIQATDANITTINSGRLYKLPNITANRTIDISNPSSFTGKKLNIWNQNTSGFTWSFTGATIVSPAGVDASLIPSNSFVSIESDGTQWVATVSPSGNNGITALTGDVTASGPGSATATLANTAVTPGSYTNTNITVDSKGRVTAAANGSAGGSSLTPTAVKTSNYTAAASDFVPVNTTSGAVTITLPTAPADKTVIGVKLVIQGVGNNVTVATGGSDVFNKTGGPTSGTILLLNQGLLLQYNASGGIWYVTSDDLPLGSLDLRYPQLATSNTFTGAPQIMNTTSQPATNSIVWFGDSITFGFSLTVTADRFSTRISSALGYTENNQGTNGLTAQTVASGNTITAHVSGMQYLNIELGTNDINTGRTPAQLQADLSTIIGQAIAKGWTSVQIRVCSLFGFQTFTSGANLIAANTAIAAAVTASGGTYVDCYSSILTGLPYGNTQNMTSDGIHPNDNYGSPAITNVLIGQFANIFTAGSQGALINGADIANLKVKNYVKKSAGTVLGVDSLGNVYPLLGLPDKQLFLGTGWFNKAIVQSNRGNFGINAAGMPNYLPAAFSAANDFAGTLAGAKIYSAFASNLYGYIEVCNGSDLSMNFSNTTGASNGGFSFTSNGTLGLRQNNAGVITANQGVVVPIGVSLPFSQTAGGGQTGTMSLLDGSGNGGYNNSFPTGTFTYQMSNGTGGSLTPFIKIFPNGSTVFQGGGTFVNNGFPIEVVGALARFTGGAAYGTIGAVTTNAASNSTTGGTLPAATYFLYVIPIDAYGNLGAKSIQTTTTTTGTTSTITQTWTNNPLAVGGYRVYIGTVSNGENIYLQVGAGVTTVTYTGSGATSGAVPTQDRTFLGLIDANGIGTLKGFNAIGSTSGTVSINPQAAAGTYNFNLPTTAGSAGQVLTSQGGGSTAMTWSGLFNPPAVVSSAGTLAITEGNDYIFTGTTTTWTFQAISATHTGRAYQVTIKNRGSGNITLNSNAGGNDFYDTSAVATLTITPGSAITLMPDGTFENRE